MTTKLFLFLGVVSLLLCAGCGSSSGTSGFIPTGNFSTASLNGQYVYQIEGFDFSTSTSGVPYREAGVFTANGGGSLTTVTDDFSEGGSVGTTISTGTYGINNDGTGTLSLNNVLGTVTFEVTQLGQAGLLPRYRRYSVARRPRFADRRRLLSARSVSRALSGRLVVPLDIRQGLLLPSHVGLPITRPSRRSFSSWLAPTDLIPPMS